MNSFEQAAGNAPARIRIGSRTSVIVIIAALVLSAMLNILLAQRIRTLTHAREIGMNERVLKVGTYVQPISVKGLAGQQELISYQGASQPTVLYVFTPLCSWCTRNLDNFKTLMEKKGTEYRFIGLSLSREGLAEYVSKNELRLPIYSNLSIEAREAYRMSGTPQTTVISPDGRVLQNWMGAYVGDQKSQIEAFFHVALPGLRELPKAEAAKN